MSNEKHSQLGGLALDLVGVNSIFVQHIENAFLNVSIARELMAHLHHSIRQLRRHAFEQRVLHDTTRHNDAVRTEQRAANLDQR